ncbi:MAG: hypothetical protein CMI77_00440 [Candidatus Pelagibacter sp.]|nr:hypothetical protein [Candidatus Pelagibacter sp.]
MLRLIFLFLFTLLLISFGASNLETIKLSLFPFTADLTLPIYLFFYLSLSFGVIVSSIYFKFKKRKK